MSESRFSQLRFDISEKVRLHPQQPGISTLLEVDLYPDVEIKDEGEHLKIQGYLRLSGAYLGDTNMNQGTEQREELAYVIPVEVTIPSNRVEMENVLAEVETFDYNVISPVELQIDAVLAIDGLLEGENDADVAQKEEPLHEPLEERNTQPSFSAQSAVTENAHKMVEREVKSDNDTMEKKAFHEYAEPPSFEQDETENNNASRPELHFSFNHQKEKEPQKENNREQPSSVEYLNNIWAKKREVVDSSNEEEYVQDKFAMEKEMEQEAGNSTSNTPKEDRDIAWAQWLVQNKEESFVPMKLAIVQKDESIDTIAEKYDTSAGHLMRINNLEEDGVAEGQIMCVPQREAQRTS